MSFSLSPKLNNDYFRRHPSTRLNQITAIQKTEHKQNLLIGMGIELGTTTAKSRSYLLYLCVSCISNKGKPWSPSEDARHQSIQKSQYEEKEHSIVRHHQNIKSQPAPWIQYTLNYQGQDQENIQHYGLHCIKSHVTTETRVSHHGRIEGEEGYEGSIGNGLISLEKGKQGFEKNLRFRVLHEEVAAVL